MIWLQDYLEAARLEREARAAARKAIGMAVELRQHGAGMEPGARREMASGARDTAAHAMDLAAQCEGALQTSMFVVGSHYYAIRNGAASAASLASAAVKRVDRYMERYGKEEAA